MRELPEVEEWRPVADWPDYAVSNLGRVKRLTSRTRAKAGSILKAFPRTKKDPYATVTLCRDGDTRQTAVHLLVAAAFIGPCPAGHEVNHKNGDKTDPDESNLEYLTSSGKKLHSFATGLQSLAGVLNTQAKLTEDDVRAIKRAAPVTIAAQEALARSFGIGRSTLRDIVRGRTWTHVAP